MESGPLYVTPIPSVLTRLLRDHCIAAGLTGFAVFISVAGIVMSSFMLAVPVLYEKYDRFSTLARAMKELRVAFILCGTSTGVALLIACVHFYHQCRIEY
jgi:hypothetical protein